MMNLAIFYMVAFFLCAFAVLAVTVGNVFHSAVWLTMTLLCVAGIYFMLNAGFLAVVQILVYVGGIMTLFIFAIMLTEKIGDHSIRQVNRQFWPGLIAALVFLAVLLTVALATPWVGSLANNATDLKTLGVSLITRHALPFEFISVLLLAALVGAIVIGKVKK